jgi:hypothetical protein
MNKLLKTAENVPLLRSEYCSRCPAVESISQRRLRCIRVMPCLSLAEQKNFLSPHGVVSAKKPETPAGTHHCIAQDSVRSTPDTDVQRGEESIRTGPGPDTNGSASSPMPFIVYPVTWISSSAAKWATWLPTLHRRQPGSSEASQGGLRQADGDTINMQLW